jgi:IclR family pca regulon transcriptional regulator
MSSLARGLAVIRAFSQQRRELTIAQLSHRTDIPRAAVRRCLYTLGKLGYVGTEDGRTYALRPRILALGHAYLSSTPLATAVQPLLDQISDELNESSSMGRVLLADLPPAQLDQYLSRVTLTRLTNRTVSTAAELKRALAEIRRDGYAIVDQELEIGLRSIAAPLRVGGATIAAINLAAAAPRVPIDELRGVMLPELRRTAELISAALERERRPVESVAVATAG